MITEDEAFWAGIAVAVMMLGGGFSMLFLHTFTGYGAVVLALGLMTMALTIQSRAKPSQRVETFTRARVLTPTPPVVSPPETARTLTPYEPSREEAKAEQSPSAEATQPEPSERVESTQPSEHVEPTPTEPVPSVEPAVNEPPQPVQPQVPVEERVEPPKPEEKPREEPQVTPPAN